MKIHRFRRQIPSIHRPSKLLHIISIIKIIKPILIPQPHPAKKKKKKRKINCTWFKPCCLLLLFYSILSIFSKYMSSLVKKILACCLFGAGLVSKSIVAYCFGTLHNKFQWNMHQNTTIFIQGNITEKVVRKIAAILLCQWLATESVTT